VRWFTREWTSGVLSEEEWGRAVPAYRRHVERIRPLLVARADDLLDVNVHDGEVLDFSVAEPDFTLTLRIGDLQVGYEMATLIYRRARLLIPSPTDVDDVLSSGVEALYDEVDVLGDELVHRVLLWPTGEVHIAFDTVGVQRRSAPPP
jgi:hypothetical protein